jgi:allantoicase
MGDKKRKHHDTVVIALKHASVIKTLALATAGFKNGTINVI